MDHELGGRGSIPGGASFFLYSVASRPALGPAHPPIHWVPWALSPVVKRPGHEYNYSPPCNAEVKNGGAIHPLPHTFSWRGA
jgi:hypothetical protein